MTQIRKEEDAACLDNVQSNLPVIKVSNVDTNIALKCNLYS